MAPRPNSSIISYLPAFVCVVILSSSGAGKRPFVFFLVHAHDRGLAVRGLWQRHSRAHPCALSSTVPGKFSIGQRYWGTSVSHSPSAGSAAPKSLVFLIWHGPTRGQHPLPPPTLPPPPS